MLNHLIGFSFFVGWLYPFYGLPIYSFYQEWAAGLFACAAFWVAISSKRIARSIPLLPIAFPVLGLFTIGLLQWLLGSHPFPSAIALYGIAGVLFWMAVTLGAAIGRQSESRELDGTLSIIFRWLLASAVASALITFLQLINWDIYFFPLVRSPDLSLNRPSANLSQPNLMSLQMVIGMISLGWMYTEKKISSIPAVALLALLAITVFFANTRAYILMMGTAAIFSWKVESPRARFLRIWACALLPLAFIIATPYYDDVMGWLGHVGRISPSLSAQGDGRWRIWGATFEIIKNHPLLGIGLGAYAVGFYDQAVGWYGTIGATGNAHNLILQVTAECGIIAGLTISGLMAHWFYKAITIRTKSNYHAFGSAIVGVILAHSLVEFPLWHIFFLIPAGFFIGLTSFDARINIKIPRSIAIAGATLSTLLALSIHADYSKVREYFEDAVTIGNAEKIEQLKSYNKPSWLAWHLDYAKFLFLHEEEMPVEKIWQLGAETVPRFPFSKGLMRFAYLSVSTGHDEDASKALAVLYRTRPPAFHAFREEIFMACVVDGDQNDPYCKLKLLVSQLTPALDEGSAR